MRLFTILTLFFLNSCVVQNMPLEPEIIYLPSDRVVATLEETFPPLSPEEMQTSWGQELYLGQQFGKEVDLYRALTALKRARLLIDRCSGRLPQIDYSIVFAYYLAKKYQEAICHFEQSSISCVDQNFPGFHTLLTILYECYDKTGQCEKASAILDIIHEVCEEQVPLLQCGTALEIGALDALPCIEKPLCTELVLDQFLADYEGRKKSAVKAQLFNAVLPGAGYYYMDQPKTAITAALLNTLFIAATWQLFDKGYVAPALFTLSLELGWYFGGINGAGLLAKEFNEHLYNTYGKEAMLNARLFPLLQIQKGF